VVEPSGTDTGGYGDDVLTAIRKQSYFSHVLQPVEVAEAVLFFISHQARFITEQRLYLR
jgi:hypothetical protein